MKAASVNTTDQFRMGCTLRFPRFKSLRTDRKWDSALTISGFLALKANAEKERKEKEFKVDDTRKSKRARITRKKPLTVAGNECVVTTPYAAPQTSSSATTTNVFQNLNFYILTESLKPTRRSKLELEELVKAHGGNIFRKQDSAPNIICIADKMTVPVSALKKRNVTDVFRALWLFDCLAMAEIDHAADRAPLLLPPEERHMLFMTQGGSEEKKVRGSVDAFGDSFARAVSVDELREIINGMDVNNPGIVPFNAQEFQMELSEHGHELGDARGWLFEGLRVYFDGLDFDKTSSGIDSERSSEQLRLRMARNTVRFGGAEIATSINGDDKEITHIVVDNEKEQLTDLKAIRESIASRKRLPRIVTMDWVERSWEEKTRLAEEKFEAR